MTKTLTIKVEEELVEKVKVLATNNDTTVTELIKNYLVSLTEPKQKEIEITPLVKSLSGVVVLPENFDYREEYRSFISEKYK